MALKRFCFAHFVLSTTVACAANYYVGPGKALESLSEVPWVSLNPGDKVYIYWRSEPYREKFVIGRSGTASAPISVVGVPGPGGVLPVIDGNGAVTVPGVQFTNEDRGVIKIGSTSSPANSSPSYVTIDRLEVRGGALGNSFRSDTGTQASYSKNAAGIYIEKGTRITIQRCYIHSNGNGIFVSAGSGSVPSSDIRIRFNHIRGNGYAGDFLHHNVYSEALRITYEFNRFGPLVAGSEGSNLKDRSAGLTVQANWIEGGNRQLDLVDSQKPALLESPAYRETRVVGNVLIEYEGPDNSQFAHYGYDGSVERSRNGLLLFWNNTLISYRSSATIVRLSNPEVTADLRNNIFHAMRPDGRISIIYGSGVAEISGNSLPARWSRLATGSTGVVNDLGGNLTGQNPTFLNEAAQDFRIAPYSPLVDRAVTRHPRSSNPYYEYLKHQYSKRRIAAGERVDIGAYESSAANR